MSVTRPPTARVQDAGPVAASVKQAAAMMGVSERTVWNARRVGREAPDLVPQIAAGNLTIAAALREIKRRQGGAEVSARRVEEMKGLAAWLVQREDEYMTRARTLRLIELLEGRGWGE